MRHLIEITASDVESAGLAVDAVLPAAWITSQTEDAEAHADVDGRVKVRLSRSGRADIVVRGGVTATVSVPCARCLKPTPVEVQAELALLLKPNPSLAKPKPAPDGPKGAASKAASSKEGASKPRRAESTPSAAKSDRGKAQRMAEYEFSSEEAEHDEYDGETIVLDGFVREAILLELPNFPLCSETCAGISPRPPSRRDAFGGGGAPQAAAPIRKNPFEALKHLSGGLPKGPEIVESGAARESDGESTAEGAEGGREDALQNPLWGALERLGDAGSKKARGEAKIASTHSAPGRRGPSKKKASGGGTAGKAAKSKKH